MMLYFTVAGMTWELDFATAVIDGADSSVND